jgi:hypothetical protein
MMRRQNRRGEKMQKLGWVAMGDLYFVLGNPEEYAQPQEK